MDQTREEQSGIFLLAAYMTTDLHHIGRSAPNGQHRLCKIWYNMSLTVEYKYEGKDYTSVTAVTVFDK